MNVVYAIVNQKGGVGKTTTAVNLSAALVRQGLRVLLVDSDPQGNATSGVGIDKNVLQQCLYDCIVRGVAAADVRLSCSVNGLHLLPATIKLADAEVEMVRLEGRETRLRNTLLPIRDEYDIILVDCPPSVGLLTVNTLVAADGAIVPMQCEFYSLEGVSNLLNTIELVRRQLNPPLRIEGVLATMYDPRMNLTEQVVSELRTYFGDRLFKTVIPRNVRLSEAPSHGLSVLDYDPRCRGAEAYLQLAQEIIERGKKGPGARP
ncbi:MAG: ParA family protein [Armatimonadota bacterium]|nr:ParA family protein [Armatimonadota bacterium]